ncbi:MAG: hypothetical protein ACETV1_06275, partial [Candidatus Bathyarchaeia archaeon]
MEDLGPSKDRALLCFVDWCCLYDRLLMCDSLAVELHLEDRDRKGCNRLEHDSSGYSWELEKE